MRHKVFVLIVLFVIAIGAVCTSAEAQQFTVSKAPGQQERGARLGSRDMKLTLNDAVSLALAHNINIETARLSLASSEQSIFGSTGIFDPLFKADASLNDSRSTSSSQLEGASNPVSKGKSLNMSLGKLFSTGTSVGVRFNNSRGETNNQYDFYNPKYASSFGLSVSQPLLQGFGKRIVTANIIIAKKSRDITALQFEQLIMTTLQMVEQSYWTLIATRDNLEVKKQSLQRAQDLLEQTRTRVRIGTSAPIEIVQAEATVATREQDIILAENAIGDAEDSLKKLLGFENTEDWDAVITPVDSLEIKPQSVDLDQAIEQALQQRREIKAKEIDSEIRDINLMLAKNNVKPQLDFSLNYGLSGLGGTKHTTTGTVSGGWNDAITQIRDRDNRGWTATLNFTQQIFNHDAKAKMAISRYNVETGKQNLALQRQAVISEVRGATRDLNAGVRNIAAAAKARELAERNLDAEQKKFANGMSTNYMVLKIQDDLAAAQVAELQARVGYRRAKVSYQVAIGNLLEAMGITIKD